MTIDGVEAVPVTPIRDPYQFVADYGGSAAIQFMVWLILAWTAAKFFGLGALRSATLDWFKATQHLIQKIDGKVDSWDANSARQEKAVTELALQVNTIMATLKDVKDMDEQANKKLDKLIEGQQQIKDEVKDIKREQQQQQKPRQQ